MNSGFPATPVAWFDADAITGISSGSTLQTWSDNSGNGYNATQSNASQRPAYVAGAMNGHAAVRFNNANSTALFFNRPVQDDFTIVCVFQSTQGLNTGTLYYQGAGLVNGEVSGSTTDFGTCLFANGSVCAGTGQPDVAANSAPGYNDGRPHVMVFERTKATGLVALYLDGTLAGTTTGGTASLTAPAQLALGAQATSLSYLSGDITAVQLFTSVLSDGDRQTVESSLAQKYNIRPQAPPGFYLQLQNGQPVLNWLAAPGAANYYVKRATTADGPFTAIATNSATTFTDLTASPTNVYYYIVSAVSVGLTSTDSTVISTKALLDSHDNIGPSSRKTPVVISEIMYKPAPRSDGKNLEFVEIYNSNPWFQDLSGYTLTCADVSYTFPTHTTLGGGAYLVVAAVPSDLTSVYGITNVMGPYTGSLKKSETLQLLDEQRAVLLTVPYASVAPWPVAADGAGHSLVLANPTYGEGDPRAWDISEVVGGSPGQAEIFHPSPLRHMVINEFLAHTDLPEHDYIELYNHSAASVDISGCILTDDPATNRFVIPNGTSIPAGGFISYDDTQFNFRLDATGEAIYLKNPDQTRVLDAVTFGAQENGVATGRWPDGAPDFYRLSALTPGATNAAILTSPVVINELMYDPISGNDDDQYIELYNRSGGALDLGGWQLGDGVSYTIPANTTLGAGGYLVIAKNAAQLLSHYPNLNAANCRGDFSGKLAHGGEHLALTKPVQHKVTDGDGNTVTNIINVMVNDLTYGTGGRWGHWSAGGGSSLELKDANSDNRLAANWADSDETAKSAWTNIETTGVLDNGANRESSIAHAQLGLLDEGECLVDNVEVNYNGNNYVSNGGFESGTNNWAFQGDMCRSSLENSGYASSHSLHIRASGSLFTGVNSCQVALSNTSLQSGQTATLRFKARWLRGWPEALLRLNGNWLEAAGNLPVPLNLGTPGMANSQAVANAGPAIYNVTHTPPLPAL